MNHENKLCLRHPLPSFGIFSFFQASIWLGVDKVLQKWTKSCKIELRHLYQCCILIPRKCPHKTPFQHTVPVDPPIFSVFPTALRFCLDGGIHLSIIPNFNIYWCWQIPSKSQQVLQLLHTIHTRIGKKYQFTCRVLSWGFQNVLKWFYEKKEL